LPTLVAEAGAGQSVRAAVREVLGHVDTVVTDNAAPLHSLIINLAAFPMRLAATRRTWMASSPGWSA
jgi:phospholipid/cholesterol/gamma-HCH transport system substrate-binding protein